MLEAELFTSVAKPVHDSFLKHLENEDAEREQKYRELREYYEGIHETQLTARQRTYLQLKAHDEFSANYIPIVIDGMARRLCPYFAVKKMSETGILTFNNSNSSDYLEGYKFLVDQGFYHKDST